MYRPDSTAIDDPALLRDVMDQISFGALVTSLGGEFEITHLPLLVRYEEGKTVLEGHFARANPHWKMEGPSVVIFQGPQAYVSPSFYPSKAVHGKVVPTWAYIVVHAHGHFETVQDGAWLQAHISALSDRHEAAQSKPWSVSDAPVAYLAALKRGIVGFRFTVDRLEGKWKVNQHKSSQDRQGTYDGLMASGEQGQDLAQALASFPEKD
ncbi:FMN-binding negative transcriptional regulator [Celeribacter arenosi]|uniref:FMN-binding negative transcriptional regulator n=1 Tax=Celeribacter arenosi TaxID=792649 RepID=A0ABP7K9T1_9RHOB